MSRGGRNTGSLGAKDRRRRYRSVYRRDGSRCVKCGAVENLTVDHIVPRGDGGSNLIANLQLLCRGCHAAKNREERAAA